MTESDTTDEWYRIEGDLDDIDDAAEIGRAVKCDLEARMEMHPDEIVTVGINIDEVDRQERCPHRENHF